MKRINIKTSLIFWDIVTFIVIFISTYLMFEVVIKNIISNSSNSDFYEKLDSIETEYFNAFDYLENKDTLVYFDYVDEILEYSVSSAKNKIKYDESIFAIVTDITGIELHSGKKNSDDFTLELTENQLRDIEFYAAHIPFKIERSEFSALFNLAKTPEDKNFIRDLYQEIDEENMEITRTPTKEDRDIYFRIKTDSSYISDKTVSFDFRFNREEYIGIVEYAKHGIILDNGSVSYPIFIVADLKDDFYYLINKVRNTFLVILGFIFVMVVIVKLITTSKITREIASIGNMISEEGEKIRTRGLVTESVVPIPTDFRETSILYDSYANLHNRLNVLGEIVSGISDRELLTAVLMDTTSVLDPHEEEMTILFLDIKGFTTLTEKYQEKVFTIVNSIWMEVEKIIDQNNGKINKYIGDACLIIFQEDKGDHNSCFYALKCAVLILEKVKELREILEIDFNFRVGLDYGKVVYGKTGTDNNYELGVIGDTVNTSARLEAINKQYNTNLLMTETVVERTKTQLKGLNNQLSYYKVDKVRPKGKKVAKELYTILANNGKHSRFIGEDKYVSNKSLKHIQDIMDSYTEGISLWKDPTDKQPGREKWIETLNSIKRAYRVEPLPTMEKYISRIVTVNEFEEYKVDKEAWFRKKNHEIQEPSDDWINYGYIEIAK